MAPCLLEYPLQQHQKKGASMTAFIHHPGILAIAPNGAPNGIEPSVAVADFKSGSDMATGSEEDIDCLHEFALEALEGRSSINGASARAGSHDPEMKERWLREQREALDALCDFALDAIGCHDPVKRAEVLTYEEPGLKIGPGSR
jgi:hypothetical protein